MIVLSLIIFLFSCQESDIKVDTPFTLAYEEIAEFREGNFTIQFIDLIGDSRCPSDVTCIWAGQAQVKLRLQHSFYDSFKEVELILGELRDGESKSVVWNDYTIELQQVSPYPSAEKMESEKSEYSIQIIIKE